MRGTVKQVMDTSNQAALVEAVRQLNAANSQLSELLNARRAERDACANELLSIESSLHSLSAQVAAAGVNIGEKSCREALASAADKLRKAADMMK